MKETSGFEKKGAVNPIATRKGIFLTYLNHITSEQ